MTDHQMFEQWYENHQAAPEVLEVLGAFGPDQAKEILFFVWKAGSSEGWRAGLLVGGVREEELPRPR